MFLVLPKCGHREAFSRKSGLGEREALAEGPIRKWPLRAAFSAVRLVTNSVLASHVLRAKVRRTAVPTFVTAPDERAVGSTGPSYLLQATPVALRISPSWVCCR